MAIVNGRSGVPLSRIPFRLTQTLTYAVCNLVKIYNIFYTLFSEKRLIESSFIFSPALVFRFGIFFQVFIDTNNKSDFGTKDLTMKLVLSEALDYYEIEYQIIFGKSSLTQGI